MSNSILSERLLLWREKHISQRQFVYILSFIVGIVSGLAAVILKNAVLITHHFLSARVHSGELNFLYLLFPITGIILTVLFVRYFVRDNISHGITRILYAISKKKGELPKHNNYSSLIASTLTVGFGGSVGLESPIVLTGSSMGSTLSRIFKLDYKTTILLIGCGAAGAIAGIFKAPIAAVIFALEVLLLDLTIGSIIPLLISAVTGLTISYFFLGRAELFVFVLKEPVMLNRIPYYIILGIFCGLISYYFTIGTMFIETQFSKIKNSYLKPLLGGSLLGITILFLPPLYGEGYTTLEKLLSGNVIEITYGSPFYGYQNNFLIFGIYLLLILIFKVAASSFTTGAGGVGGIFAPALFMGGIGGYFASRVINLFGNNLASERNFALLGMAGMMSGIMHAPLTGIFLIAEITGGYGLLLPLIITSICSYLTIKTFQPHSLYALRLAQRGELITHHKDKAILTLMEIETVLETDFVNVMPNDNLKDIVNAISNSKRNLFPVVNNGTLVGIVLLDDIRHIIFNTEMYKTIYVRDVMILPPTHIDPSDPMDVVMKKFEDTGSWNLPVIKNGKYIGFLSKSRLFTVYRKWLLDISGEE
jgi:chloride channel protein, CIC family